MRCNDGAENFTDGLAPIKKGEKYGYINKEGKIVIPIIYDYASKFFNKIASVQKDGKNYAINIYGEELIFSQKNEKWGIINSEGKEYKNNFNFFYQNKEFDELFTSIINEKDNPWSTKH